MITRNELQEKANRLNLNMGQTEKNYLQMITLHAITKLAPELFVFKGGTALMILHNLNRFSEDLDFIIANVAAFNLDMFLEKLKRQLREQDIDFDIEKAEETLVSKTFIVRYKGPLYVGTKQSTSKVELDLSERETIILKPEMKRIIPLYQEIPSFYVQTMSLDEIFAEKIRAILTRNKARDLFDVEFLIAKGVRVDVSLINEKLKYYDKKFSKKELQIAIEKKEKLWRAELGNLVTHLPEFKEVQERIINYFS